MYEYIITLGLNDKDTKIQEISTERANEMLDRVLLKHFGIYAFTKINCTGAYKHENGDIVNENSIRVEIASDNDISQKIKILIKALKKVFNQETIMIKYQVADIKFI